MKPIKLVYVVIIALVVGAAAFYGGMLYQKSQRAQFNGQFARQFNNRQGGANGQRTMMGRFEGANGGLVMGEVIKSDDNSITIKMQDGSTKIVILSSNTSINKQASGTKEDLSTGVTVAVIGKTNSDGSVTAQNIQLNPQFRTRGGVQPSMTPQQ